MLHCTFLGKFDHLHDKENTICKISNHVLQREGILDEEVDCGIDFSLTREEKVALDTTASKGKKFKKLAPATEFIEDHVQYKSNDFCYDKIGNSFVEVLEIIQIESGNYAKVARYVALEDTETGLWHGPNKDVSQEFLPLKGLTKPFVIAREANEIWFVGHEHQTEFSWFKDHVKL